MPADSVKIDFLTKEGTRIGVMTLYAESEGTGPFVIPAEEAAENLEASAQLLENVGYEYKLEPVGSKLREQPGIIRPSRTGDERGRITPGLNVGRLRLTLINDSAGSEGVADLEVRAVKVGYRDAYRVMLKYIMDRCTDLLLEFRSPVKQPLIPDDTREPETLCQRFAFIRSLLSSREFEDALQRITALPHRLWEQEETEVALAHGIKPTAAIARQIASSARRMPLSPSHPLAQRMSSVPERVTTARNSETVDTPENRFVKHALKTFQAFTAEIRERLQILNRAGDERFIQEAEMLEEQLAEALNHDLFREISEPEIMPLGSPVLQSKGGYRELLTVWLQFDMAARLCWAGGTDVYGAGKRDIATLYEYWLFFRLLEIVADIFKLDEPPAAKLITETDDGFGLRLKAGRYIPLAGEYDEMGRKLKIKFCYNRTFKRKPSGDTENNFPAEGSWTERMRPDYTLSLWPAGYSENEAERQELIVHVHFDAKYRVEKLPDIFGKLDEEFSDQDSLDADLATDKEAQRQGRYVRGDLLKMHAYKDAIRRTVGAYVLYPGSQNRNWRGFHEIIPGLGAFGIRPVENGADGSAELSGFIRNIAEHACNRTTARERVSFHITEAYKIKEEPVSYGSLRLPESDIYGTDYRALPPAEHLVLLAWYETDAQLALATQSNGLVFVRLGRRSGALHVHPNLARVRSVVLRTHQSVVAPGILELREPGFRVYTRTQLRQELNSRAKQPGVTAWEQSAGKDDDEYIYALFQTKPDFSYEGLEWGGNTLLELIERFETDVRNKLVENVRRTSPYPRIISLRDVLKARKPRDGNVID